MFEAFFSPMCVKQHLARVPTFKRTDSRKASRRNLSTL